jgi:hypothetical protein
LTYNLSASDVDEDDLIYLAESDYGSTTIDGAVLSFTPPLNYNGDVSISVTVSDEQLTDTGNFTVTVIPINDAPIATSTSAITDEDVSVTVDLIGSDIDNEDLVYLLDQDSSDGFVDIEGSQGTFTPDENFNGTTTFTYLVSDGELTSTSATVTITVNPVNDAPVLSDIDDQSINEDGIFFYELVATDVDDTELSYSATVDANASVDVVGSTLTITPDLNYNGDIAVNVTVSDGDLTDSGSFILTVNPINDAPILSDIDNQSMDEDEVFTYALVTTDVDDIDLSYSTTVDGHASVDVTGSTLTITPNLNYNGEIAVNVTVSDGELTDSGGFTLTINSVNDAPVLTNILNDNIDEDGVFTYELVATDVDDTELSYSATVDGHASVDVVGSTLTITPDLNYNGDIAVNVTVSDGDLTDSGSFILTVNPINDAPILSDIDNQSMDEDEVFTYALVTTDVDDIDLSYSTTVDGHASVDVTGSTLTITPNLNYNGEIAVNVTVSDGELTDSGGFTLTINSVNDAPVLTNILNDNIDEDGVFTYELVATDVDDTELSYSATVDGHASVDVVGSTLTITPDLNYNGDIAVDVTVSDGDIIDSDSFTLKVNPVNDTPLLSDIDDQSIDEDGVFTYELSATDVDDTDLSYSTTIDGHASMINLYHPHL